MSITPELATEQRQSTLEAAVAFLEDLGYMRNIVAIEFPERGEIRRLSAVLRRLLVDNGGDLRKIAPCRIGRLELKAQDTKIYVRSKPQFFMNCRGPVISSWPNNRTRPMVESNDLKGPLREITLSLDGFVQQQIMCFQGRWLRRGDLIKHIANIASGVHSTHSMTDTDLAIEKARSSLLRKSVDGQHTITLNRSLFGPARDPVKYDGLALDPVHLALVSTAELLLKSDGISALIEVINAEIE
jgi:hypothetical protein